MRLAEAVLMVAVGRGQRLVRWTEMSQTTDAVVVICCFLSEAVFTGGRQTCCRSVVMFC